MPEKLERKCFDTIYHRIYIIYSTGMRKHFTAINATPNSTGNSFILHKIKCNFASVNTFVPLEIKINRLFDISHGQNMTSKYNIRCGNVPHIYTVRFATVSTIEDVFK